MSYAIFLSAGIPDPKRGPEFAKTADSVAITAAVSALVYVTLGRRPLVWGGQPGITPMIWVVAQRLGVDYGRWVKLYQTRHFAEDFPEENARFQNVVYTADIDLDREKSLLEMRRSMFSDEHFSAAVFIGGMQGIIDEFKLFRELQPKAKALPIASTGGAVLKLLPEIPKFESDLALDMDYVALFHRHLDISPKEKRYNRPEDQPSDVRDRYFKHPNAKPTNIATPS
jgi:hypothetical protein